MIDNKIFIPAYNFHGMVTSKSNTLLTFYKESSDSFNLAQNFFTLEAPQKSGVYVKTFVIGGEEVKNSMWEPCTQLSQIRSL